MSRSNAHLFTAITMNCALAAFPALMYAQNAAGPTGQQHAKKPIPGHYIVVLKQSASGPSNPAANPATTAKNLSIQYGGRLGFTYEHAIHGFSIELSEAQALALAKDPLVEFVQEDSMASATAAETPASWNLDRIDQRQGTDGTYNYMFTGGGVHAYVLDTGLRVNSDFGTRADIVADFVNDGRNGDDCNGHGTWVAGILGGAKYGVAKGVFIHAVRVLDCAGNAPVSRVIAGVDWVTGHSLRPAVANMSLIGDINLSLDGVVRNSIAAGITYAVGAGNDSADASNYSPARVSEAITVAAVDQNNSRASFSNFGSVVDVFAPGVEVPAYTNTGSFWAASGTSAATPHVAGVAAMFLQNNPYAAPATVATAIRDAATKNIVQNPGTGSPNNMLFVNFPSSAVTITGQEQYECVASGTRECAYLDWDSGTVTVTINGRNHSVSYGPSSKTVTVAAALAASISTDPAVVASSYGSVVTVVSKTFSCFTISSSSSTSQPNMFVPSFTANPSAPSCF